MHGPYRILRFREIGHQRGKFFCQRFRITRRLNGKVDCDMTLNSTFRYCAHISFSFSGSFRRQNNDVLRGLTSSVTMLLAKQKTRHGLRHFGNEIAPLFRQAAMLGIANVDHTAGEEDWVECVQRPWRPIKT
jgi:hypothetical protein